MPTAKFTLIGTGGVWATPVHGCNCAACNRAEQQEVYQRKPASALLEIEGKTLLIDAGIEDLPERFPPDCLDAVLLTHFHMDHVLGLFRLRWHKGAPIPVFCPPDKQGCDDLLKHQIGLNFQEVAEFEPFELFKVKITPLPLIHSKLCYGWHLQIGAYHIAYLTDTFGLPAATLAYLKTIKLDDVILDCSYPPGSWPQQNHNDLKAALELSNEISPKRTVLTHINHELDCYLMEHPNLPAGIRVPRDNFSVHIKE